MYSTKLYVAIHPIFELRYRKGEVSSKLKTFMKKAHIINGCPKRISYEQNRSK
jgi:hypothetical protein